jgi:predicted esterase
LRHASLRQWLRRLRRAAIGIALIGVATSCAPAAAAAEPWPPAGPSVVTINIWPLLSPGGLAAFGRPILEEGGLRIPTSLVLDKPVPVVLALHGAGSSGPRFAERIAACAERNGWVLVAPTLTYRSVMDAEQLRLDDQQDLPALRKLVQDVRASLAELPLADAEFVYGFSRGAQLAHRLALLYPDRVAGVAAASAGTYTVPRTGTVGRPLRFPFGVADLERYGGHPFEPAALVGKPFWIGVGANDDVAEQVPRAWDQLLGRTRLERATRFAQELQALGAQVSLNVFADTGHEETAVMRERACEFLTSLTPVRAR